jgi:hypothetical protein
MWHDINKVKRERKRETRRGDRNKDKLKEPSRPPKKRRTSLKKAELPNEAALLPAVYQKLELRLPVRDAA